MVSIVSLYYLRNMKVIIDERERELYDRCYGIVNSNGTYVVLSKEVLALGDIFITTDEGKHVLIIERKSLSDLLASIKDGRYEEQSYRLTHSSNMPPHSILYIIEGQFSQLRTSMEKKIVYSAITSLNFFKGFSVIRTNNLVETAEQIVWMAEKIERNFLRCVFPYYLQPQYCKYMQMPEPTANAPIDNIEEDGEERPRVSILENIMNPTASTAPAIVGEMFTVPPENLPPSAEITSANYCTVVKKVKKDNVTPENIGEIILCQIPGISAVTAMAVMKKFSTFPNLIKELQSNPQCLEDIQCDTKGKVRKIGKNCVENIKKYLL